MKPSTIFGVKTKLARKQLFAYLNYPIHGREYVDNATEDEIEFQTSRIFSEAMVADAIRILERYKNNLDKDSRDSILYRKNGLVSYRHIRRSMILLKSIVDEKELRGITGESDANEILFENLVLELIRLKVIKPVSKTKISQMNKKLAMCFQLSDE